MGMLKYNIDMIFALDAGARLQRSALIAITLLVIDGLAHHAGAGELLVNDLGVIQLAQAGVEGQTGGLSATIPPPAGPAPGRFALADQYKLGSCRVPGW